MRQIQGARGGPLVVGADFVQPVAVVGSSEGEYRNPALEFGEGISRRFVARATATSVVFQFGVVQLSCPDPFNLVHVRRVGISVDNTTCRILVGRTTLVSSSNINVAATGNFTDNRQPIIALGGEGPLLIGAGCTDGATAVGYLGAQELQCPINQTQYIEVDYVLTSQLTQQAGFNGALVVSAQTTQTVFRCSFEGEFYSFGAGSR